MVKNVNDPFSNYQSASMALVVSEDSNIVATYTLSDENTVCQRNTHCLYVAAVDASHLRPDEHPQVGKNVVSIQSSA